MNKAVWIRTGAALAGVALLVGGLTACGAGEGAGATGKDDKQVDGGHGGVDHAQKPTEAVAASYKKTVAAKFAKASVSTVEADGTTREETGVKGWYPYSMDTTSGGKRSIMIGDTVYSPVEKDKNGGKPWMKLELGTPDKPGVRLNENPVEYLAMLLDQEKLKHVGAERTDGIDAQHYQGTFTLDELLQSDSKSRLLEDKQRQALYDALKKARVKTYAFDLWIDKEGFPVRVDSVLTDEKGPSKTGAKFSDFGKATPVEAPPADQVSDFDAVQKETDRKLKEAQDTLDGLRG